MKEIISSYRMDVYSDGSIEFIKLSETDTDLESTISLDAPDGKTSAKIDQILRVLSELQSYSERIRKLYEFGMRPIKGELTNAIKSVSNELRISQNSINDKLSRQCDIKLTDWENKIEKMIIYNNPNEVKNFLRKNVIPRCREADLKAIDEFFKKYYPED